MQPSSIKLLLCLGAEEQRQHPALAEAGSLMRQQCLWWSLPFIHGFLLLLQILFHPSMWGKARPCRWPCAPGQGELCDWKLAKAHRRLESQLVALHHPCKAPEVPRRRGRAGIKQESRSERQHKGSWLLVEPERVLWAWGYPAMAMKLEKGGQKEPVSHSKVQFGSAKEACADLEGKEGHDGWLWATYSEGWSAKSCQQGAKEHQTSICEPNRRVTQMWW